MKKYEFIKEYERQVRADKRKFIESMPLEFWDQFSSNEIFNMYVLIMEARALVI